MKAYLHSTGGSLQIVVLCMSFLALADPASFATAAQASETTEFRWTRLAEQSLPATVNIQVSKIALDESDPETGAKTTPGERSQFFGSGFIIDPSGLIVTNKHVVEGALSITVILQDATELQAAVIGEAPLIDLAVLKVSAGHVLPTLSFSTGDDPKPGDPVLAIGDPLGVGTSLSAGIVSGTQRDLMNSPYDDYIQTDAAINHGNSGGPLIDASGKVIGVNSILYTNQENEGSNGVGFSISSDVVRLVVSHLLHPPDRFGWIGLHLQGMTPNLSRALRAPPSGALVTKVDPDTAASVVGIIPGDVILSFDGKNTSNARQLMASIATAPIGTKRPISYWTGGSVRIAEVEIRAWRSDKQDDTENLDPRCLSSPRADLGLLLEPITPLDRQLYSITDVQGLVVVAVDPQSEAFGRGFRPGVVIERINDQEVNSVKAAQETLTKLTSEASLVALLVDWAKGPSWFTLHTGYKPSTSSNTDKYGPSNCQNSDLDARSGDASSKAATGASRK